MIQTLTLQIPFEDDGLAVILRPPTLREWNLYYYQALVQGQSAALAMAARASTAADADRSARAHCAHGERIAEYALAALRAIGKPPEGETVDGLIERAGQQRTQVLVEIAAALAAWTAPRPLLGNSSAGSSGSESAELATGALASA